METIKDVHGRKVSVEDAAADFGLDPIVERHGVWCVTDFGIECLATDYSISKEVLRADFWIDHMSAKNWVNVDDFIAAYYAALQYHYPKPEAA